MPLIPCPDCGTEVSDRAPACVRCGAPIAATPQTPVPSQPVPPVIAAPPLPPAERVILSEGDVSVSTARFVVGAQTYPISNVSSVKWFATPPNTSLAVLLILLGALLLVYAITQKEAGAVFLAVGALGGGVALWRASKAVCHVVLATSGGEVRAVSSTDRASVERIVGALNQAIVSRG